MTLNFNRAWRLFWLPLLACLACAALAPAASAQGPVQTNPSGARYDFRFQWFYALTPDGQVYRLQFDTRTNHLVQANQPAFFDSRLKAIASTSPETFYAITSDGRVIYVDDSGPNGSRSKVVSTNAPNEAGARYYFGCNDRLYTVIANGDLVSRTWSGLTPDKLVAGLTAPQKVGNGWNADTATCVSGEVKSIGNFGVVVDNIYLKTAAGDISLYDNAFGAANPWTVSDLKLNFDIHLPRVRLNATTVFGRGVVLVARFGLPGKPTQFAVYSNDVEGTSWPHGPKVGQPINSLVDLTRFRAIAFSALSYRTIQ